MLRTEYETTTLRGHMGLPPARSLGERRAASRVVEQRRSRASVLEGLGSRLVVADDVDVEDPHPGEVRVQVTHCGVCHSDLHFVHGDLPTPFPVVLGHEAAGVVETVGAGVDSLAVGDKVILTLQAQCGRCYFCARWRRPPAACWATASRQACSPTAAPGCHGAGTSCTAASGSAASPSTSSHRPARAVKVAADTPLDIACLLGCAVQTGVGAVLNTAGVGVGDTVMVIGLGGVGHLGRAGSPPGRRVPHRRRRPGGEPAGPVLGLRRRRCHRPRRGRHRRRRPRADRRHRPRSRHRHRRHPGHDHERHHGHPPGWVRHRRGRARLRGHDRAAVIVWALSEKRVTGSFMGSSNSHREVPPPAGPVRPASSTSTAWCTTTRSLSEIPDAFDDLVAGHGLRTVIDLAK